MRLIHYGWDASVKEELYVTGDEEVLAVVGEMLKRLDDEDWIEVEKVVEPEET